MTTTARVHPTERFPTTVPDLYLVRRTDSAWPRGIDGAYVSESGARFIVTNRVLAWDDGKPEIPRLFAQLLLSEEGGAE